MKSESTRAYRQNVRARAAEQTRRNVMEAAVALWRKRDWEQVTLSDIAKEAGVTSQTVLRRFGSKDGVVDACLEERASGIEARRDRAPVGDPEGALDVLLDHYERDGDDVLRTLGLEERSAVARRIVQHGRDHHRAWCARVFAPYLPTPRARSYAARLDAFVAATDLSLWKLLRRDLGRTPAQTRQVLTDLVRGLVAPPRKRRLLVEQPSDLADPKPLDAERAARLSEWLDEELEAAGLDAGGAIESGRFDPPAMPLPLETSTVALADRDGFATLLTSASEHVVLLSFPGSAPLVISNGALVELAPPTPNDGGTETKCASCTCESAVSAFLHGLAIHTPVNQASVFVGSLCEYPVIAAFIYGGVGWVAAGPGGGTAIASAANAVSVLCHAETVRSGLEPIINLDDTIDQAAAKICSSVGK